MNSTPETANVFKHVFYPRLCIHAEQQVMKFNVGVRFSRERDWPESLQIKYPNEWVKAFWERAIGSVDTDCLVIALEKLCSTMLVRLQTTCAALNEHVTLQM